MGLHFNWHWEPFGGYQLLQDACPSVMFESFLFDFTATFSGGGARFTLSRLLNKTAPAAPLLSLLSRLPFHGQA